MNKSFLQVRVDRVRELAESGAFIIDVCTKAMYEQGHLRTAANIPMAQICECLNEIPKDRPVYVHRKIGQTSYNAVMALQGNGLKNVFNNSCGFLGICCYEYFNDKTKNREPIVTNYSFD